MEAKAHTWDYIHSDTNWFNGAYRAIHNVTGGKGVKPFKM